MATDTGSGLQEALRKACSSKEGVPPMPRAPLRVALQTSPALRRPLPRALTVRAALARGAAAWARDAGERERALAAMRTLLGDTHRAAEAQELARAHSLEGRVHEALFWGRWWRPAMSATSRARLEEASASGRGVLLSSCHQGPIFLQLDSLAVPGRTLYVATGRWFFEPPSSDAWGRRIAHWWQRASVRDEAYVPTEGSYADLRTLLAHGRTVAIYFDMPGSQRTRFLGKDVSFASGSARLAGEADALVLPIRARREGAGAWVDVEQPLDPRAHDSHEALHGALAAVHERGILERPEAVEDPNRPGGWGERLA